MDTENLGSLLSAGFEDRYWEEIAERCLTCGNCTMVCPTCFCVNIEDSTNLTGTEAYRTRRMDSCFSVGFSYIHGGSIRTSEMSRYRQWMMHKLSYWLEQFGVFGCVGCGRCITWCPVGIDITKEAAQFRERIQAQYR
jgi:ferredoxin